MLLSLNFSNLNAEGYAAFILAIIFTILTISSVIFLLRHSDLNKNLAYVITLILPFVTIFCWLYLIFNILEQTLVLSLCIPLACATVYVVVAAVIACLADASKKKKANKTEAVVEETVQPEVAEETVIEDAPVVEDTEVVENAESPVVDAETVETVAENNEEAPAETVEEPAEEAPAETVEDVVTEETVEIEPAQPVENETVEEVVEEIPTQEATAVETEQVTEETPVVETVEENVENENNDNE